MKIELQEGYLLTSRPYLETSLLIDVFTKEYGRISLVAKGVKRGNSAKFALLQQFMPLLLSWQGRGALCTLIGVELGNHPNFLRAKKLISGMYINELLVKLLAVGDPHVELYNFYQQIINQLAAEGTTAILDQEALQALLRIFEKRLLIAIGYALPLCKDLVSGAMINSSSYYNFDLERGPILLAADDAANWQCSADPAGQLLPQNIFAGSSLLALEQEIFTNKQQLQDAKRLLRAALKLRLGDMPVYSRKLLYAG